jgi:hypothetical protein
MFGPQFNNAMALYNSFYVFYKAFCIKTTGERFTVCRKLFYAIAEQAERCRLHTVLSAVM